MLTNSCSPSKMTDGWIYWTDCPIFYEMLMNSFGPNVEFSDEQEKRGFSKKLRKFEYWVQRSRQEKGTQKTVKIDEICRSRQEVSKVYLMVEFHLILFWFIEIPPPPRAGRSNFENKERNRMSTWREGVRQVTNTVQRNIGAQSDNYGGQYKYS